MRVYLAGPINGCSDDEARAWREDAKRLLVDHEALDPMDRDYRGREREHYQEIVDGDKAEIESSDALLVMYDRPSVGTSMEILWAWLARKFVVLVDRSTRPLSPWLLAHVSVVVPSLEVGCSSISAHITLTGSD